MRAALSEPRPGERALSQDFAQDRMVSAYEALAAAP
jgi:hypothetical protein